MLNDHENNFKFIALSIEQISRWLVCFRVYGLDLQKTCFIGVLFRTSF